MTRLTVLTGLALLLAAAGCKEDNPRLAVGDDRCVTSEDCPEGQECTLGTCEGTDPQCTTDDDCDDGESCVAGVCDGRAGECEADDDCGEDEVCVEGSCAGAGCGTDDECPEGEVCRDGTCQRPDDGCGSDDDCDEGEICTDGACIEAPECTTDDDCDEGQRCEDAACVDPPRCGGDEDCGEGELCIDGGCVPSTCEPGATRCDGNAVATCEESGLDETVTECGDLASCIVSDGVAACVVRICEPDAVNCADAITVAVCDTTGTLLSETPCEGGEVCTDGACTARACEPFEIGCLDGGVAFACDADGRLEALPCGDAQYCLDAQCLDRVCEPAAIACDGNALVACDELGAVETRTECDEADACANNPFGCACTDAVCAPRACAPDARRCIANSAQVCDPLGLGWSDLQSCGDEGLCVAGTCLDVVCEPGVRTCEGETLTVCNQNGTVRTETDCAGNDQLCDIDAPACVDRACDPGSTVCNGDTVFECTERGDGYGELEVCTNGERCRGGECRDTCDPGATRCNGNTLYTCLNDGLNEEARECGDQAACLGGACVPRICTPGAGGCNGSRVTTCNSTGTAYVPTGVDCASDGLACDAGACVRINVCPTTVAEASSQAVGVGTRQRDLVTVASAGLLLDGRRSTDDTGVDRVTWTQTTGPATTIAVGQDRRTATVAGLTANQRYVFSATAIDLDGLASCAAQTIEVFTVSDDYLVVHLTWQDPGDADQNDNTGADVDLHLVKAEEGRWAQTPYAVYYANRQPEWNPENPIHLFDDTNGRGPETIVMDNPDDCQWYGVGAQFFRQAFGPVTLGLNVFIDGQLAYANYDQQLTTGQFTEALLIHHPTGEVFEVGAVHAQTPNGQRPTFTEEAIDSGLCGIPDDVVPLSCEDYLGDISAADRSAPLQGYDDLTVCAEEPDYFDQPGGSDFLLVQVDGDVDTEVLNSNQQVIARTNDQGAVRAAMPDRGDVWVRVSTDSDTPLPYDIDAVECTEDEFVGNQTAERSIEVITGMEPDLSICGHTGPDWFHADLLIGDRFMFTSTQDVNFANVQVAMYGPTNQLVAESRGNQVVKTITSGNVTVAGRYRVQALVAGSLDVASYDIAVTITRSPVGIDVLPIDLQWEPVVLERGSSFTLSATIVNVGARGARASNARVYLRNGNNEDDLGFPAQEPVPAQTVRTDRFTIDVPDDAHAGTQELCFEYDEGGEVNEYNETNNTRCESVTVSNCVDPYEPNGTTQQAVSSGANWIAAANNDVELDLCPQGDQDWFYATPGRGERTFCVEGTNNQSFFTLVLQVGDQSTTRTGTNPCITSNFTSEARVFLRVSGFGGDRVPYGVTYR